MGKIFRFVGSVLFLCGLPAVNSSAATDVSTEAQKTEVVIVGTIHSAHFKNPKYSSEILKEIILSLRPDAILNELPLSQVKPNGRPLFRDPQKHPEGWAADTVATQLGIRQIPFDRPDREENFRKTKYFEREKRWSAAIDKWCKQVKKEDPNSMDLRIALLWLRDAQRAHGHLTTNGPPEVINSKTNDSIIRIKHSVWYDIFPSILTKYPGYEILIDDCRYFKDQWHERNRIMADNIVRAAKGYPGKRLVIVTGNYHRYILRDLLKDEKSIELKEYWEIKQ